MEDSKESRLRAEFEAWARAEYPEAKFVRYSDSGPRQWHRFDRPGEYEFHEVQFAFEGYRAASASRSEILEALEELDSAQASANTTSECIDIAAHYEAMDRLNAAWKSARALLAKYQGE